MAQESVANIYEINKRLDIAMQDVYRLRSYAGQTLQAFDDQMAQLDLFIKESAGRLYISAGNAGMEEAVHYPYAAQESGYGEESPYEAAYSVQGEDAYYPPQTQAEPVRENPDREEGAFAEGTSPCGAGKEAHDFFTQPAGV